MELITKNWDATTAFNPADKSSMNWRMSVVSPKDPVQWRLLRTNAPVYPAFEQPWNPENVSVAKDRYFSVSNGPLLTGGINFNILNGAKSMCMFKKMKIRMNSTLKFPPAQSSVTLGVGNTDPVLPLINALGRSKVMLIGPHSSTGLGANTGRVNMYYRYKWLNVGK